eukprot:CAMPEP_0119069264 /NCGR_PEP_ID=MMETSP1178-20130426/11777_1 /TAXON_ID=33656 /ORGANISM="unid sp, Strain CCMP2000" /LENGTH=46 /DNA_ID= /DNA_START= /DNA_END= /DNA_ORIENTATION=
MSFSKEESALSAFFTSAVFSTASTPGRAPRRAPTIAAVAGDGATGS